MDAGINEGLEYIKDEPEVITQESSVDARQVITLSDLPEDEILFLLGLGSESQEYAADLIFKGRTDDALTFAQELMNERRHSDLMKKISRLEI